MKQISRYICILLLLSFTFGASAGNILQCLDMPQQNESPQIPADSEMSDCHTNKSDNDDFNDCCLDMSSCHSTALHFENAITASLQIEHQAEQWNVLKEAVNNTSSPPIPPPKTTS